MFGKTLYLGLAGCLVFGTLSCTSSMTSIETRPGVRVDVILAVPKGEPKGIFLLFPGGPGLLWNRRGDLRQNFPVVPSLFAEQGFVAAVVNAPSDQAGGFASGRIFRASSEHVEDTRKVLDYLYQKWPKPVFLLGHRSGGHPLQM